MHRFSLFSFPCFFRITLFLFLFAPVVLKAQNLVQNGDFTNIGANWTFFAPATGTEAYLSEASYGGTVTTNIVAEIDAEANLRQTNINVTPGVAYYLSFRRVRRQNGAPATTGVRAKVYNGTNVFLTQDFLSTDLTWHWNCEVVQFTPTTNTVSLDFENIVTTGTLGTMLDDVTITPVDQVITINGNACQGGTVTLEAPSFPGNGNANYSNYTWSGPNGFTGTGASITFNNAQPAINGTYSCTMTLNYCLEVSGTYTLTVTPTTEDVYKEICSGETYDFYGKPIFAAGTYDTLIAGNGNCDRKITLHMTIKPKPDVTLSNRSPLAFCTGEYVVLQLAHPDNSVTYQWFNSTTPVSGETGPQYTAKGSGDFKVEATLDGCTDESEIITVTENPLPEAGIINSNPDLCAMSDTALLAAQPGNNYTYRWSPEKPFRFVTGAESETVQGVFDKTTQVILTVYSDAGCRSTDTTLILTHACCEVFAPSAFSPNNDGLNDMFAPYLKSGQLLLQMQVFNRYGNLMYEQKDNLKGWNGQSKEGVAVDAGTYMYYLRYTCTDGNTYEKKGDLTLIR